MDDETYYDPTRQPKSGLAVPKAKYCKVQQERHRRDFLKKYTAILKKDLRQPNEKSKR
jgi:hypothetical protein|tara:strand:- start:5350 stop:5523 length:174 start_codon:yes stop_codon:yes gene_type:complete